MMTVSLFKSWHYLFFRAVASQVFSARVSLTAVFGMGTGGPSPQSAPTGQTQTILSQCHLYFNWFSS